MKKQKPVTVAVNSRTQALQCKLCGSVMAIPLGSIPFVVAVFKAFGRAHKHCKAGDRPATWSSVPTIPVTTNESRDTARA